jgi:hypothetical protein
VVVVDALQESDVSRVPEIFETIERFAMPSADFGAFKTTSMLADWFRAEPARYYAFRV